MEEAEDEMKNKQYGGEVYCYGLEIGESDGVEFVVLGG